MPIDPLPSRQLGPVPISSLSRGQFAASSGADPRGLAESAPTARFVRTDESLFSEDVLHFVSPGVGGCGALLSACSVPETVTLFASPASCARHWSVTAFRDGWRDRVFALRLTEEEYVMGAGGSAIRGAIREMLGKLPRRPRAVFICGACIDDLLGTDLGGVCRELEAEYDIPFADLHLAPIAGRSSAPMPVRALRSMYGLLGAAGPVDPSRRDEDAANLVLNFSLVDPRDDFFAILRDMGFSTVRQLRACETYDDFLTMRRSALNVCPHLHGRPACKDMERALGIPFAIVGTRLLPEMVQAELERFAEMVGRPVDVTPYRRAAERRLEDARAWLEGVSVAIGGHGSNAFETAALLARYGARISFVMADRVSARDWAFIDELKRVQPDLPVYPQTHPAFSLATRLPLGADVAIGLEAGRLCVGGSMVDEEDELDHMGFSAALNLVDMVREALENPFDPQEYHRRRSRVRRCDDGRGGFRAAYLEGLACDVSRPVGGPTETPAAPEAAVIAEKAVAVETPVDPEAPVAPETPVALGSTSAPRRVDGAAETPVAPEILDIDGLNDARPAATRERGLESRLPTLAADYSGAVGALYDLGGLVVLHGAGACLGSAMSFEEPRAWDMPSRVLSSSLTDMDCLLGNDDHLLDQIARTHGAVGGRFIAVAGTPNSMIAGTDYDAVAREAVGRCGVPAFGLGTSGMTRYNQGAGRALLGLAKNVIAPMVHEAAGVVPGAEGSARVQRLDRAVNLLGATPLDVRDQEAVDGMIALLGAHGWRVLATWAMGSTVEDLVASFSARVNVVVATSGLPLARWMERRFGIPYMEAELSGPVCAARFCARLDSLCAGEGRPPSAGNRDGDEGTDVRRCGRVPEASLDPAADPAAATGSLSGTPSVSRALVVADRIVALSMRAALLQDCGVPSVDAATLLPGEMSDASRGFLGSLTEDGLERLLAGNTYGLLVGDAMLGRLLPANSRIRLVNVCWPALSSRLLPDPGPRPYGAGFASHVRSADHPARQVEVRTGC